MWVYVYMNILYVLFFDWPLNLMILYLGKLKYLLFPMKWWDRMPWSSFSEYWAWLWPPHVKSWLIGKDFDAGRDWGKEKKGTTEDEMTGWHHWLDGHEFEGTSGVGVDKKAWHAVIHGVQRVGHDWEIELNRSDLTSMWDECNCAVVWALFGIVFLWYWNENWPFPVLWPLLSFPNLLAYWVQHFHSIIFQDLE